MARMARGAYLLFLNQDTLATKPGWIGHMIDVMEKNNAGIVGPKLVFPDGSIQSCGGLFDAGKGPYHRNLGWSNAQDWRVNTTERVSWITGAAILVRAEDFWQVGGMDEGYRGGYFEDVDLCLKMKHQLGKDTWYCAEAVLQHAVGSTGGNPENFRANSLRFHERWDSKIVPDSQYVYVNY